MPIQDLRETLKAASAIWVEVKNKNQPRSGFWKLGKSLVARVKGDSGRRSHELMRKPCPGDPVIHIHETKEDGWNIEWVSRIKDRFVEPKSADQNYVRQLKDTTKWHLSIEELFRKYGKEIRQEIESFGAKGPERYPFRRKGTAQVTLMRAPYLSKATPRLVEVFLKANKDSSDRIEEKPGNVRPSAGRPRRRNNPESKTPAAASSPYARYVRENEIKVSPQHNTLQKRFEKFLEANVKQNGINTDSALESDVGGVDLRFRHAARGLVLVEVKPCVHKNARYAIRIATGQLLDYRQKTPQASSLLIVVGVKPTNNDRLLATMNGFGIAYPSKNRFEIIWPS